MEKKLQAIYKDGVLRPLEPLPLEDMQQVTITISDSPATDDNLAVGYFTPEVWAAASRDDIGLDEVRRAYPRSLALSLRP